MTSLEIIILHSSANRELLLDIMLLSNVIWILFAVFSTVNIANASEYHHNPRIILTEKDMAFRRYSRNGTHFRAELIHGPHNDSIYVGGHRTLSYVDFQIPSQSKEVILFENECREQKSSDSCEHDITILHTLKDRKEIFVCGTNDILPVCCYMTQSKFGTCPSLKESAEGIAPFSVKEKAPSLYIENELFTTANLYARGDGVGIRRHFGTKDKLSPPANKTEQIFVAMAMSGPRDDPLQDRIYAFLTERNQDKQPEADRWASQVVQVCKVDCGGTKQILERQWTSLLRARLYCGIHFSKILDVDVLHAANWRESKVYALFSSVWGMRAVCVYTLGTIDGVFMNSTFKNVGGPSSNNQPRMCVENSQNLPRDVLRQIKYNQEMKDQIRPVNDSPFLVSYRHYKHIRADTVTGRDQHTVLFLSLDSGKVHKVLEQGGPLFIIAELQPFNKRTHIQNMLLQSSTKKMYVSSSTEVVELDLRSCMKYGLRCEDCVQARDPYCGWDGTKCTAASSDTVQDVEHGNYTVCKEEGKTDKYVTPRKVDNLLPLAKYFLQCPTLSGHAHYSWHHHGMRTECLQAEGQCLLLIENMTPELEGNYSCVSSEGGYERTLVEYELRIETTVTINNPDLVRQPTAVCTTMPLGSAVLSLFVLRLLSVPSPNWKLTRKASTKELDLSSCIKYQRCEDCVQARDPYCSWDGIKCTAASGDTVQDVEHGNYTVCKEEGKTDNYVAPRKVDNLRPLAKHFLQCPTLSGHAHYSWHHHGMRTECLQAEGQCLLLIENMTPELEGNYSCVSSEGGYERTLVEYELRIESTVTINNPDLVPQPTTVCTTMPLGSAVLSLFVLRLLSVPSPNWKLTRKPSSKELDLSSCIKYQRCEDCVQARDPYCSWNGTKCTAASSDPAQDVEHGNYTVCEEAGKTETNIGSRKFFNLPPLAKYILLCPTVSGHAKYSWHHHGRTTECLHAEGQCLHLIENMSPELEGNYSCVSSEGGYERMLVEYELRIESRAQGLDSSLLASVVLLICLILLY